MGRGSEVRGIIIKHVEHEREKESYAAKWDVLFEKFYILMTGLFAGIV